MKCSFWIESKKNTCKNDALKKSCFCHLHGSKYSQVTDKPSECCVCTDSFDEKVNPLMPCGHWIHLECIYKSGKKECPICRCELKLTPQQEAKIVAHLPHSSDPFYEETQPQTIDTFFQRFRDSFGSRIGEDFHMSNGNFSINYIPTTERYEEFVNQTWAPIDLGRNRPSISFQSNLEPTDAYSQARRETILFDQPLINLQDIPSRSNRINPIQPVNSQRSNGVFLFPEQNRRFNQRLVVRQNILGPTNSSIRTNSSQRTRTLSQPQVPQPQVPQPQVPQPHVSQSISGASGCLIGNPNQPNIQRENRSPIVSRQEQKSNVNETINRILQIYRQRHSELSQNRNNMHDQIDNDLRQYLNQTGPITTVTPNNIQVQLQSTSEQSQAPRPQVPQPQVSQPSEAPEESDPSPFEIITSVISELMKQFL